jgi:hypothetical protein
LLLVLVVVVFQHAACPAAIVVWPLTDLCFFRCWLLDDTSLFAAGVAALRFFMLLLVEQVLERWAGVIVILAVRNDFAAGCCDDSYWSSRNGSNSEAARILFL